MKFLYETTENVTVLDENNESLPTEVVVYTYVAELGDEVLVSGIVGPSVHGLARVEERVDGHCLVTFTKEAIVTLEWPGEDAENPSNIRFARLNNFRFSRHKLKELSADQGRKVHAFHNRYVRFGGWRRLLRAALDDGRRVWFVPGGLKFARVREGEVIVPYPRPDRWYNNLSEVEEFAIVRKDEVDELLGETGEDFNDHDDAVTSAVESSPSPTTRSYDNLR